MGDSDSDDNEVSHIRKRRNVSCVYSSSDESENCDSEKDSSSEYEPEDDFSSESDFEDDNSDSGSEEDDQSSEWDIEENTRAPFDFCGNSGLQFDVPISSRKNCLFYFDKFLDSEILSKIVEETNLYAAQYI